MADKKRQYFAILQSWKRLVFWIMLTNDHRSWSSVLCSQMIKQKISRLIAVVEMLSHDGVLEERSPVAFLSAHHHVVHPCNVQKYFLLATTSYIVHVHVYCAAQRVVRRYLLLQCTFSSIAPCVALLYIFFPSLCKIVHPVFFIAPCVTTSYFTIHPLIQFSLYLRTWGSDYAMHEQE